MFRGHLEADSRVTVVTRYELRACEPGVRVRTDLYNGAPDPNTLYLADGLFWGDHDAAPFVPGPGLGFRAPELDLTDVASAWREWPFLAARSQAAPDTSYAVVPCDPPARRVQRSDADPAGVPLTTTLPGDGIHFERFIIATPGRRGWRPAVGEALRVRAMVHGEPAPVTVTGRVVAGGTADRRTLGAGGLAAVLRARASVPTPTIRRGASRGARRCRAATDASRSTLPADRAYRVQPYAFGLPAAAADVVRGRARRRRHRRHHADGVRASRGDGRDRSGPARPGPKTYAELVMVPVDPPAGAEPPSLYGLFPGCNPMLGPPHGGSPACNRAVTQRRARSIC